MLEVFITDLAAYNTGYLIGNWFTLPVTEEELALAIKQVLSEGATVCGDSYHEEMFITDYEWQDHELCTVEEYSNLFELNNQLQLLVDKSDYELKAISFLLSEGLAVDIEDAIFKSDDVRIYENQNMEDIAYDILQDCYGVDQLPAIIANNIDYESVARCLKMDGCYFEVGNDIFEYIG